MDEGAYRALTNSREGYWVFVHNSSDIWCITWQERCQRGYRSLPKLSMYSVYPSGFPRSCLCWRPKNIFRRRSWGYRPGPRWRRRPYSDASFPQSRFAVSRWRRIHCFDSSVLKHILKDAGYLAVRVDVVLFQHGNSRRIVRPLDLRVGRCVQVDCHIAG